MGQASAYIRIVQWTKTGRIAICFLTVWLALSLFWGTLAAAATLYVDANAAGVPEDGSSWEQAFRTVQAGLDAAKAGDAVWVAAGTYPEAVVLPAQVRLLGGFLLGDALESDRDPTANPTTLDASNVTGPRHVVTGADGSELDGFTVTGGDAFTDLISADGIFGGGLYLSGASMTVANCIFSGNTAAERGGAVYLTNATASLTDCTVIMNEANVAGGGIASVNSSLTLTRCRIIDNDAGGGPGIFFSGGTGTFSRVLFQVNAGGLGGGLYALSSATLFLTNCIFDSNTAVNGGAIYNSSATVDAAFCTLAGNRASSGGGAISNFGATMATNSILWDNGAAPVQDGGIVLSITSSIVEGGYAGTGNRDADPVFRLVPDPAPYPLTWQSPARDASAGAPPATDYAGQTRTNGEPADIGALEFGTDTDGGGLPDDYEAANNFDAGNPGDDAADTDEDGLDNREEFRRGSDPNNDTDPPSVFYVDSVNGSDETGDGSADFPWATVPFAFTQIPEGAPTFKISVILLPGDYNVQVTLPPYVSLGGATPADRAAVRILYREDTANFTVVTGAEGACLQNCTVAVDGSVLGNVELLRIEDVSMRAEQVVFDGLTNADSIGLTVAGPASSNSVVRDCVIRRVREGVRAVNSGATVTRCLFERIQGTALLVELPENGTKGVNTPLLGDQNQGEETGFNQFREVTGMFVDYATPSDAGTLAQYNDWGLDDPTLVQERVSAQVVVEPIVAKRIGAGSLAVDILEENSGEQISAGTASSVLLDQSISTERDTESLLFVFDTVAPGPHTLDAMANGYGDTSAPIDTAGLTIDYVSLSLERTAQPEDIDGINGVNAVDVQLAIRGALDLPTGFNTDVDGSNRTNAIDVQLVIIAALAR